MQRSILIVLALVGFLLFPPKLFADAKKSEWFGEWAMNYDGHIGTLRITELSADCAISLWCDMAISYQGSNRDRYGGRIEKIDGKWQHMVFYINFPGKGQKFDAYLFSWDKQKMAGTTYWGGSVFGFYATKKINNAAKTPTSIKQLQEIALRIKPEKLLKERANGPKFRIDGNTFAFYQGDLPELTNSDGYASPAQKPILIPLARFIQLRDLRQFINQHQDADPNFWQPYFNEAEAIIEKRILALIASGITDTKILYQRVTSYDNAIDLIIKEKAPMAFAQKHRLQQRNPGIIRFAKHLIPVTFVINPRPARLFIIDETGYLLAEALQDEPRWREILTDKEQLGGWYFYKVEWPDFKSEKQLILVNEANNSLRINKGK